MAPMSKLLSDVRRLDLGMCRGARLLSLSSGRILWSALWLVLATVRRDQPPLRPLWNSWHIFLNLKLRID